MSTAIWYRRPTLADLQAMSHATDVEHLGIEVNANHVRGIREGWVHGTARPLHIGRTTQLWEIRVVDDAARLVCISRRTIGVMPREAIR